LLGYHVMMLLIRTRRSYDKKPVGKRHTQAIKYCVNWQYSYIKPKAISAKDEVLIPFLFDRFYHYRFIFLIVQLRTAVSMIQKGTRHMLKLKKMRLNILHNKLIEVFQSYRMEMDKSRDRVE
jgi:hypothetical protein